MGIASFKQRSTCPKISNYFILNSLLKDRHVIPQVLKSGTEREGRERRFCFCATVFSMDTLIAQSSCSTGALGMRSGGAQRAPLTREHCPFPEHCEGLRECPHGPALLPCLATGLSSRESGFPVAVPKHEVLPDF